MLCFHREVRQQFWQFLQPGKIVLLSQTSHYRAEESENSGLETNQPNCNMHI